MKREFIPWKNVPVGAWYRGQSHLDPIEKKISDTHGQGDGYRINYAVYPHWLLLPCEIVDPPSWAHEVEGHDPH